MRPLATQPCQLAKGPRKGAGKGYEVQVDKRATNSGVAMGPVVVAEDSAVSPEIRSWVDNCLVPILVEEYLRETMQKNVERFPLPAQKQ
jgi:hypothetical protein